MQKEDQQPYLSLPQRAYLIADSLNEGARFLAIMFGGLTLYILIGLYFFFFENDSEALVFFTILFYVIFTPFIIWKLVKMRNFNKQLEEWKEDYVVDMCSLIFNTTIPKGKTTGEKILSLASMVFPQMRKDYIKYSLSVRLHIKYYLTKFRKFNGGHIPSMSLNYLAKPDYDLDVVFRTLEGYLVIKGFRDRVVTVDDLNYLIEIIASNFKAKFSRGTGVFAVICVAKEYDEPFLNRRSLEKIMTEDLKTDFGIDLIVEEDIGYSVLWIDPVL
jgi:hypothetical protein